MKRFKWPLQCLLDVTSQRETARRAELLQLSREIARVHQEILHHRTVLSGLLADLASDSLAERIRKQEVFMECSRSTQNLIVQLTAKARELKSRRQDQTDKLTRTRSFRETLERLREQARQRHVREQDRLELKALDESAQTAFARKRIEERIAQQRA